MAKKKDKKAAKPAVKAKAPKVSELAQIENRLMARIEKLSVELLGGPVTYSGDVEVTVGGEKLAACTTTEIAAVDVEASAARISALGHPVRLAMCLAAAEGPVRVTHLMESLGINTTGQAYHHLRILLKEGWMTGDGDYQLAPGKLPLLQGIVALATS